MRSITTRNGSVDSDVLVLGATGRLGQMLLQHWPRPGQLVGQSRQPREGMIALDPLASPDRLAQASEGVKAVICLSGVTPAYAAAQSSGMELNSDLALAAVAAAPAGARIFLASSAAVYGAADGPHLETDAVDPVSAYGRAKHQMEQAALARADRDICILRIGNVAGADAILGGWQPGMALDQLGDGSTPRRSYIGPRTFAHAVHSLCDAPAVPKIVNVAAPGVVAMGDLLDAAALPWTRRVPQGDVIEEVRLATHELEQFFTFAPQASLPSGMVAEWRMGTNIS